MFVSIFSQGGAFYLFASSRVFSVSRTSQNIESVFKWNVLTEKSLIIFNSASFRFDISEQDWVSVNNYEDPNDMWKAWKSLSVQCVDKHAPLRSKRVRAMKSPWITPHLKKRTHPYNILKLKAVRSKNADDWLKSKKCRNAVSNEIKLAKEQYYKECPLQDNERDPRNTWQIIYELTSMLNMEKGVDDAKHGQI